MIMNNYEFSKYDYETKLIDNRKKQITDIYENELLFTNNELNLETSRKMIAQLVVKNTNMQRKMIKAMEHLKIKQARLINEENYVITDLDLDEIMQDLESKGEE